MRSALLLGLRLSMGNSGQRARTIVTGVASAVGVVVVLLVWGAAVSALGTTTQFQYNPGAVSLLVVGTVGMVALPVAALVATIARLSASVRDRRLANLRLLGLTAGQTRLVAAAEVGLASLAGAALGVVLALGVAAVGTRALQIDADWGIVSLWPPPYTWIVLPLVVPVVAVATSVLSQRLPSGSALARVRLGAGGRVRLLRVLPLVLGFLLCWSTRTPLLDGTHKLENWEIVATVAGIALLGIGMLLVIPVFMSLIAICVLRLGRGPLATLVGRRLQTQPAGATRVMAALMMGLFIVVAARGVLVVFLATPQYVAAADFVEREQTAEVTATAADLDRTVGDLAAIDGVRRVSSFPVLQGEPTDAAPDGSNTVTVVVAACEDLTATPTELPGCSDRQPSLVGDPWIMVPDAETMKVRADHGSEAHGAAVEVDLRLATVIAPVDFEREVGALSGALVVVVPPGTAGVPVLLPQTDRLVVVHAGPGRYLYASVEEAGYHFNSMVDLQNYDFVQGMLTMVWTLAAVIIAIGLATFTVAGIDRAVGRRRELTALRLIGTPARLLRRAQWLEAALPTVLGCVLAILAGAYAGATYLQRDDSLNISLASTISLAAIAIATSGLLAVVTTAGTASRLDPDHIRSE
jgi:putative ABC transport system permease protein